MARGRISNFKGKKASPFKRGSATRSKVPGRRRYS